MATVGPVWSSVTSSTDPALGLVAASNDLKVMVLRPTTSGTTAFQAVVPVAVPVAPPPSARLQVTLAMPEPAPSLAVPLTATFAAPTTAGLAGDEIEMVGRPVSWVTVSTFCVVLPALSVAVTVIVFVPAARVVVVVDVQFPAAIVLT